MSTYRQDVYVNDAGRSIRALTPIQTMGPDLAPVVVGDRKYLADLVIPVQVGPGSMSVSMTVEITATSVEDALEQIPAALEAARPAALEAARKQLATMQAEAQAEARKIVVARESGSPNGLNHRGLKLSS